MPHSFTLALIPVVVLGMAGTTAAQSRPEERPGPQQRREIVFVCEHGAALSVVAAAYFNKMANEERLGLHAIARGTEPQPELAESARAGLAADGMAVETAQPRKLLKSDAANALRLIAFLPLPPEYSGLAPLDTWSDVPPTAENYARARDAIVRHLKELLRELQEPTKR